MTYVLLNYSEKANLFFYGWNWVKTNFKDIFFFLCETEKKSFFREKKWNQVKKKKKKKMV